MKRIIFTSLLVVITFTNVQALLTSPDANAATVPADSINAKCYQTYGYCSPWDMGFMCTSDKTSDPCHVVSKGCKNCNDIFAPGFEDLS